MMSFSQFEQQLGGAKGDLNANIPFEMRIGAHMQGRQLQPSGPFSPRNSRRCFLTVNEVLVLVGWVPSPGI